MACRGCNKKLGAMTPDRYIPCLLNQLGLAPEMASVWSLEAHIALYEELGKDETVQETRGMSRNDIAAIAFGSEPEITAGYVMGYPTRFFADDNRFWACLGIEATDAKAQMAAEEGPYYDLVSEIANWVIQTEGGKPRSEGVPMWVWVAGGLAVAGGAAYLIWGR